MDGGVMPRWGNFPPFPLEGEQWVDIEGLTPMENDKGDESDPESIDEIYEVTRNWAAALVQHDWGGDKLRTVETNQHTGSFRNQVMQCMERKLQQAASASTLVMNEKIRGNVMLQLSCLGLELQWAGRGAELNGGVGSRRVVAASQPVFAFAAASQLLPVVS